MDIYGISVWLVCLGDMSHCVSLNLLPLPSLQATTLIQLGPAQEILSCHVTDLYFSINTCKKGYIDNLASLTLLSCEIFLKKKLSILIPIR